MGILRLRITDNAYCGSTEGWPIEKYYSPNYSESDSERIRTSLRAIQSRSVSQLLSDNPNLLIFPHSILNAKDGIGDLQICHLTEDNKLKTGNLMGFVGVGDIQLSIHSRFARNDAHDYFLHYMLMKVFCPNIFNLQHSVDKSQNIFDFLIYMFPYYLNKAMSQGLFRQYMRFEHNDSRVKGPIDVARHLKLNVPFMGKVAYNTKEYSYDNHITQLIRHTIEHIKTKEYGKLLLCNETETKKNVQVIMEHTMSYDMHARQNIINKNISPVHHPFLTNYTTLQHICLQILQHDGLKYKEKDKDKVYGIMFDGGWLWEEFLNTIFQRKGYIHPKNKSFTNPIYLFEDKKNYPRFPDYYKDNEAVIDAKYKRLHNVEIDRNDIHQIITYLHVLNLQKAIFAYPIEDDEESKTSLKSIGLLRGMGGEINKLGIKVPLVEDADTFSTYHNKMKDLEDEIDKLI